MPELDLRNSPWNEGFAIPTELLKRQLYQLGCVVYASATFDKLESDALTNLREKFQEPEIGRLLLNVAVVIRNGMDQNPWRAEYWLNGIDPSVGSLMSCLPGDKAKPLSFREACNKLIHCLSINFHYSSTRPRCGLALEPMVHLYGQKGEDEWKATIEIEKFIQVACRLLN